jgi:hypothetical protein
VGARLCARALLEQDELAALEVRAGRSSIVTACSGKATSP